MAFRSDRGRGHACEISNFLQVALFIGWCRNHRSCGARRSCVCTLTFLRRGRCIHHASEVDGSSSGTICSVMVAALLFANTALMLLLEFGRKYIVPRHAPEMVDWYAGHSIAIQFILLAVLA